MLRRVEAWPATRHAHLPWHRDADFAAFLAASRGVFDLYSAELPGAEQKASASSIRLFLEEDTKRSAGFGVSVRGRFFEGFEQGWVAVPAGFAELEPGERARAALDVMHAAVQALAGVRGWDADRLEEVRHRVESRGLRFTWASDWKASPDRRHQARAVYWLDDAGHGHVQLEISPRNDPTPLARSEPVLAFMTSEGFKRSASTLGWLSRDTVSVVPWVGLFGDVDGLAQLSTAEPLALLALPQPIRLGGPTTDVTTTVVTEEELQDDADPPWLFLEADATAGSGAYGPEFERVSELLAKDDDFASWWAQTSYRCIRLRVFVLDPRDEYRPNAGARKNGDDLVLQVVTAKADLPSRNDGQALRERAREDLHRALVAVATSRRLPPPPPLPERIAMNAREWRARTDG